jgi:hypothetical protein
MLVSRRRGSVGDARQSARGASRARRNRSRSRLPIRAPGPPAASRRSAGQGRPPGRGPRESQVRAICAWMAWGPGMIGVLIQAVREFVQASHLAPPGIAWATGMAWSPQAGPALVRGPSVLLELRPVDEAQGHPEPCQRARRHRDWNRPSRRFGTPTAKSKGAAVRALRHRRGRRRLRLRSAPLPPAPRSRLAGGVPGRYPARPCCSLLP